MFAVVEIQGHQYKVEKGLTLEVERLKDAKEGDSLEFKTVMLFVDGAKVKIGDPYVVGPSVKAKVVEHFLGDKKRVFKKKAKKRFMINKGHRSRLSKLEVTDVKG